MSQDALDTCEECGFIYDLVCAPRAGHEITLAAEQFAGIIEDDKRLRERPAPDTWSVTVGQMLTTAESIITYRRRYRSQAQVQTLEAQVRRE